MSTPLPVYRVRTSHKSRASFLVRATEVLKVGDYIVSVCGDYRMTAFDGVTMKGTAHDKIMINGLFSYNDYSFKLLKRKSI